MSTFVNKLGTGSHPRLHLEQGNSDPPPTNPVTVDYGASHEIPKGNWSTWNVRDDANVSDREGHKGHYYGTISFNQNGYTGYDIKPEPRKLGYYLDKEGISFTNPELKCDIKNIHTPPPPIIPNKWSGGQGDDSPPIKTKRFWVTDYGDEPATGDKPARWTAKDGAIYQSTKRLSEGPPPNFGSRAYPICIDAGDPQWTLSAGNGDEHYGLWQIDIKIGSDGQGPFCETFYLAERFDFAWGQEHYNDGAPPDAEDPHKKCSREIDIMETRWPDGRNKGPQINLPNGNGTGWDQSAPPGGEGKTLVKWEDVGGAPTKEFITFGCLIRKAEKSGEKDKLWLYAYTPILYTHEPWYCTDAIEKNSAYNQQKPFVPYIGTWCDKKNMKVGGFETGYKNFIYLHHDHPKIAGKNPKDQPEAFGLALIPNSWQQIAGWLSHISVAVDGTVCGVNEKEGKLYRFVGGTAGSGWDSGPKAVAPAGVVPVPSDLSVVSVGSATNIWIQDKAGNTYRYVENAWGQGVGGWSPVTSTVHGGEQSICAASDGTVCGLSPNGRVLKWAFIGGWTYQEPFGAQELKVVAVGSKDHIWGVDKDDSVHRWDVNKNKWERMSGILSTISAAADGTVWGVNKNGEIYSYIDDKKGWLPRPGKLKVIAVGSKEHIWGLDEDGVIKRYIPPYTA